MRGVHAPDGHLITNMYLLSDCSLPLSSFFLFRVVCFCLGSLISVGFLFLIVLPYNLFVRVIGDSDKHQQC